MSRQLTTDEVRERLLDHFHMIVKYWASVEGPKSLEDRMNGLAFSMLAALDGTSADLPAFIVAPYPHQSDKAFRKKNKEDWYPENNAVWKKIQSDVGGCLHERWYKEKSAVLAKTDAILWVSISSVDAPTCGWSLVDEDASMWESSCGKAWEFTNDGPVENGLDFCMKCGKRVEVMPVPPPDAKEAGR